MRFVLFKGQSQYGSLRLHIDQIAVALRALGHEVEIVDLATPDAWTRLGESLEAQADCYLGVGGVGSEVQADGVSIFDSIGAAYVAIHVDHPVHLLQRMTLPIKRGAFFFLDRTHVQFVQSWPQSRGIGKLGFLPPGANELPEPPDTSDEAFARRDIPLLFTGTYRGEPQTPWRDEPESPARTILEDVARRMAADATLPVVKALRAALAQTFKAELTPELFNDFAPLLQATQAYAETVHRDAVLRTLGEAGAPLHVYGLGWEPLIERYPSFRYGGVGSFEETLTLLRRAKLVLNINNGFVEGGHERVFTAMAGGAAVISDESRYYAEAFRETELATYYWKALKGLPRKIEGLLADDRKLAAQARAGAARVAADHTWNTRVKTIVETVSTLP